ncbi:thiamine pyrophosphate-dependent dehydrogenase E1 component subunit alpha [Cutibacterium avidum]|uniref:thiamine pyrophosphate-dependent dehydrogenase E1 component subunit alpha n=1 Tax=Cutibacterium avidum TaxID=33010 RepID=UPI0015A67238|nr:thiamine pyrophosphate-dependent dehydrogenase E1 component subunit alpha [Cutibacterium avidum]MCO6631507.1 thiamine pyrophosphate-dependent dehydrogenase E1 component subunit alpha [Cutibacterium avidum]MCO6634540.1 thiamine pyrophosphate-dependent dehydrogenase E1 component subunit alpha [Cutibacterium avidum]MCO6658226.1 thiamine pyrophosphate-dependent dehydrogenase E1 component subunit alpha [Cutibacterium avidum]MCO6660813.1 thiamine pyrophosphate-dependent dehydrogenase E1 component 
MVRILDDQGRLTPHPDFPVELSDEDLVKALEMMVMVRRLDVEGTALQRHGELGLWPPHMGQEATQAGAWLALGDGDQVFPTYREQGLAHAMGVSVADILDSWSGKAHCAWDTVATHFSAYPVMIGSGTLHAVGYAMGIQRDVESGSARAAVLDFHGDGAMSEGDTNEAYVFAASMNAPVVFVCVNNQWAISEPTTVQSPTSLFRRAIGFGIPAVQVDGNDVVAMTAVLRAALDHARSGKGPVFVEAWTYRMGAHTTTDDPTRYRTADEEAIWGKTDPILRLQTYLQDRGDIDQGWLDGLAEREEAFGAEVRAAVHENPTPVMAELMSDVYAEPTPDVLADAEEISSWGEDN